MAHLPSLPEKSSLSDVFAAYPVPSEPLLRYCEAILRGQSPLSQAERELIAAYVSGLNDCEYCYGVHTGTAEAAGVAEGLIVDLLDDIEAAAVDEKLRPLLRFVRKLTLDPSGVTQADADAIYAAGWDEKALHDAISVCGLFNFFNRYTLGLGLRASREAGIKRGRMLHEIGYAGLSEKLGLAKRTDAA